MEGGEGALVRAVNNQSVEMVTLLLDFGADFNAGPRTPLIAAVKNRSTEMVTLLLNAGADINARGVLLLAVNTGSTEMVRLLLNSGADVNLHGLENPLIAAMQNQSFEMRRLLWSGYKKR